MNEKRKLPGPLMISLGIASWLINIMALASLLWVVWLSPLLGNIATEADRKAVLEKHYDDAFWAQTKTIEEVWPEVVSKQRVPYYYKHLEDAAKLLDQVGIADHKARLKPYEKLTRKERLLLARVVPDSTDDSVPAKYVAWELLKFLNGGNYYRTYGHKEHDELYDNAYVRKDLADSILYEFYTNGAERNSEMLARELRIASPISGSVISVVSDDFSPGDAYSANLSEWLTKQVIEKDRVILQYTYPVYTERDSTRYSYFRIYGESEVIAEGLYRPRGWMPEDDENIW
jgi:hypothetical protein